HEIKTGVAVEAVEELRARAGLDDVPAHVRDHRCVQSGYGSGPLATSDGFDTEFHAAVEQDLHAHAYPEDRAAGFEPFRDDLVPADGAQARHARLERADARHHQTVGGSRRTGVGGDLDISADSLQCALGRPEVA